MAYVSVSDAQKLTGQQLSTASILQAQAIIEMHSNRTEASSGGFTTRDAEWLKRATAYQAAYMDVHPELFGLMDVESVNQGDLSVKFKNSDSAMLAPLARMALKKVSWMRTRSIATNSDFQRGHQGAAGWLTDEYFSWVPL